MRDYVCSVRRIQGFRTIYSINHKNGAIRRVNVNIAATTVENYRRLKEAGIGTYILFQETYHKKSDLRDTETQCLLSDFLRFPGGNDHARIWYGQSDTCDDLSTGKAAPATAS